MNKLHLTISVLAITTLLTACNHTGINPRSPDTIPEKNSPYTLMQVYPSRADLPKNSKFVGKFTEQNKDANVVKFTPVEIMVELKRQAALLGGNGLVQLIPGTSQTTANAVFTY